MQKKFYITTPLYYPNAEPHLGTTLSTVLADVINRYKKMQHYETRFVTGLDEHGFKIWKKATVNNETPQVFVNKMAIIYKDLWAKCGIEYDCFMRTSEPQHEQQVRAIFEKLLKSKVIYFGDYKAIYCENCSEFLNYHQINSATQTCLMCAEDVSESSEASYFLKIKQNQNFLLDLINHQNFLTPPKYAKELNQNFLQQKLHDLAITRQNTTWGIKIKPEQPFVVYVWFEALLGYITNLNLFNQEANSKLNAFWQPTTEIIHVIGKEITRFHAIYWPIILKSLNLNLPTKVLTHGWLIISDKKMSKSIGNVVNPHILIDRYTRDALRFFLTSQVNLNRDFSYSHQLFLEFYNGTLVNDLGNLFSRYTKMVMQYCHGKIKAKQGDSVLIKAAQSALASFQKAFDNYDLKTAFACITSLTKKCNASIESVKPWILAKNDTAKLHDWLYTWHYVLLVIAICYQPVLVDHAPLMLASLGFRKPLTFTIATLPDSLEASTGIKLCQQLFPRVNVNQELSFLKKIT